MAHTPDLPHFFEENINLEGLFDILSPKNNLVLADDMMLSDADGIILRVSENYERNFGFAHDSIVGKSAFDLEADGTFRPCVTAEVIRQKKKITATQTINHTHKNVMTVGIPLFDQNGVLKYAVCFNTVSMEQINTIQQNYRHLQDSLQQYTQEIAELRLRATATDLVVKSPAMQRLWTLILNTANTKANILITGETGVGKSAVAKAIHAISNRANGPFIEVNCAVLHENLIESELFGYEKGAFTGAATCMGYALFFKENTLHKLYGSKPSDFQLTSLRCRGVAKNAARSLCVLNETLYYLSPDGVMAWDGSIPTKVSGVLDSGRLSNVQSAVGGALDGRYYLHIARAAAGEGVARLLVYDTERALWSEEDVCSYEMTSTGGQLYLWDGQALWAADPSRETDWQSTDGVEEKLNFELVTGDIGLDGAEDRYLSRLTLRLDAECGSTVTVAASYDGGPWETVAELAAQNVRRSYDMPFVPRRHGTLRLRLKGRGQITLRSIAKTVAAAKGGITGGEV